MQARQTLKQTIESQSFSMVNPGGWIRGFKAQIYRDHTLSVRPHTVKDAIFVENGAPNSIFECLTSPLFDQQFSDLVTKTPSQFMRAYIKDFDQKYDGEAIIRAITAVGPIEWLQRMNSITRPQKGWSKTYHTSFRSLISVYEIFDLKELAGHKEFHSTLHGHNYCGDCNYVPLVLQATLIRLRGLNKFKAQQVDMRNKSDMTEAQFDSSITKWIEWSETIDVLTVDTPSAVKFNHPTNQSLVSLAKLAEFLSDQKDKLKARALLEDVFRNRVLSTNCLQRNEKLGSRVWANNCLERSEWLRSRVWFNT